MNSKEIELVLQARLEAGDSEAKASQIGEGIARALGDALEGAFDQIGERIADALHRSIMSKMGQLDFSGVAGKIQIPGAGVGGGPPLPPLMTGGPLINPHTNRPFPKAFGGAGESNAAIEGQREQLQNQTAEEQAHQNTQAGDQSKEKMLREFLKGRAGRKKSSSIYSHGLESLGPNQGMEAFSGAVDATAHEANREADAAMSRFRVEKQLAKIDPNFKMGDETFEKAKQARVISGENAKMAAAKLEETNKTIGKLESVLDRNSKAVEALEKSMKKAVEGGNLEEAEKLKDSITRKENRGKDLQNVLDEKVYQRNRGEAQINTAASIAKEVDQEAANRKAAEEAAAGAKASARAQLVSKGLGLAAGAATIAEGWNLSRAAGQAGAARIANFEGRRVMNDDYAGQIGDELAGGKDEMLSNAKFSARAGLVKNVLYGAGAGAVGGSIIPGLGTAAGAVVGGIGGAVKSVLDYNKMDETVANHMQAQSGMKQEQYAEYIKMYGEARNRGINTYEQGQAMGDRRMSNFLYGGQSNMLMSGVEQGLSRGATDQVIQTVAGSMGNYEALSNKDFQSQLKQGMGMKANGFANYEQVAASMFAGGSYGQGAAEDRTKALKDSEEMYTRAFASGLNQSKIPEALAQVAAKAASGLGAAESAKYGFETSAAMTKDLVGRDTYEAKELDVVNRTRQSMRDATSAGGGIGAIAGYDTTRNFEKEMGVKLTTAQRIKLQGSSDISEKGLEDMLGPDQWKKVQDAAKAKGITNVADWYRSQQTESYKRNVQKLTGQEDMTNLVISRQAGNKTLEEQNLGERAVAAKDRQLTPEEIAAGHAKMEEQKRQGESAVGAAELKNRDKSGVVLAMEGLNTLAKTTAILNENLTKTIDNFRQLSQMPFQRGGNH